MRLVCDAAQGFNDLELVSFIKKYGRNPWFLHTRQSYKYEVYEKFIQHRQLNCEIIKTGNLLMQYIIIDMPPSFINHLIKYGVDVNHEDHKYNRTPFIIACSYGNHDIVKMLLDAGADPRHKTMKNDTALGIAFQSGSDEIFVLIYNALFQRNPTEKELRQQMTLMPYKMQNIILQMKGDRIMLKLIRRIYAG